MERNRLEVSSGDSHSMSDGCVRLNGARLEGVREVTFFASPGQIPHANIRIRIDDFFVDGLTIDTLNEAIKISEGIDDAKV